MSVINISLGLVLGFLGIVFFIKYGEYRRKHDLGGLTFKYIAFSFGLVAIGFYLIVKELAKII